MPLKQLRAAQQLSQVALVEKSGLSRGYIARWKRSRQDPRLGRLQRLAKVLKVTVEKSVE